MDACRVVVLEQQAQPWFAAACNNDRILLVRFQRDAVTHPEQQVQTQRQVEVIVKECLEIALIELGRHVFRRQLSSRCTRRQRRHRNQGAVLQRFGRITAQDITEEHAMLDMRAAFFIGQQQTSADRRLTGGNRAQQGLDAVAVLDRARLDGADILRAQRADRQRQFQMPLRRIEQDDGTYR